MKRVLMILLVLALLGCSAMAEEGDWYLETAVEFAGKVGELVKDDAYVQSMTGMELECLEPLKTADYSKMVSAHRCKMPDEAGVRVLLQAMTGWEMSDAALETWVAKIPVLPITINNGNFGSDELAASTLMVYSRTCAASEDFAPCTYVLELDGAVIGVAFCATGEDTITISAQPLFGEEGGTIDDLLSTFASAGFPMEVEQVY